MYTNRQKDEKWIYLIYNNCSLAKLMRSVTFDLKDHPLLILHHSVFKIYSLISNRRWQQHNTICTFYPLFFKWSKSKLQYNVKTLYSFLLLHYRPVQDFACSFNNCLVCIDFLQNILSSGFIISFYCTSNCILIVVLDIIFLFYFQTSKYLSCIRFFNTLVVMIIMSLCTKTASVGIKQVRFDLVNDQIIRFVCFLN